MRKAASLTLCLSFICGLLLLDMGLCADERPAHPRQPTYEHFKLGVFIDSTKEVLSVPLSKVFTDFLTHGIEIVCIGQHNYFPLARERNLNTYAKANGVQLICNIFYPEPVDGAQSEDDLRAYIQDQVDAVNALPDADAVVAWRTGDEIESRFWDEDRAERLEKVAANYRRFSDLVREIDPTRLVAVNHCYIPGKDWRGLGEDPPERWLDLGEDLPMSSTGATGIYNSHRIREEIASAQALGFNNYLTVSPAFRVPFGEPNLRWYGYRAPINDAVVESRSLAEHIQDYAEVAYTQGAAGMVYFLYWAGGDNYTEYTLVDADGSDYLGKWEAVRRAARNIRQWEGAPGLKITTPVNETWTTLPVKVAVEATAPGNDPVTIVQADYSLDGALSWRALPDAREVPCTFAIGADQIPELPATVWIRARAANGRGFSLWDVVEVRISRQ